MKTARKGIAWVLVPMLLLTCFAVPAAFAAATEPVVIDTSGDYTVEGSAVLDSEIGAFVLPLPELTGTEANPENPDDLPPVYETKGSVTFKDVLFEAGSYDAFSVEFAGAENVLHLEIVDNTGVTVSEATYKMPNLCDTQDMTNPFVMNFPLTEAVGGRFDVRVSVVENSMLLGERAADAKPLWLKKITFVNSKDASQRLHFMWSGQIAGAYKLADGGQVVEGLTHNSTLTYSGLEFGDVGYNQLLIKGRGNGGEVAVYLDSLENEAIASFKFDTGWHNAELPSMVFDEITGTHDVIFRFTREGAEDGEDAYVNLMDFQFVEAEITDGHTEFAANAPDATTCVTGGDSLGYYGDGRSATYNNVRFDEAVSMTFKMTDSNNRNLTTAVHLDTADGPVIGEAINLSPEKIDGGYRYYTVYFDTPVSGVHHIVLTTTEGVWNENLYTLLLNKAPEAERDGHEWMTAASADTIVGATVDTEAGKLSSFEGNGKYVIYNNVAFKNAEALILKTSKHMNRTLTMNVYLNSTGGKLVGSAVQASRYMVEETDNSERFAYFVIFFDEPITGVYNLVLTTDNLSEVEGETLNEHLYELKLTDKASVTVDGHSGFAAGAPSVAIGGVTTGEKLGYFGKGTGTIYGNVDFGTEAKGLQFEMERFTERTLTVTLRLDSAEGKIIGTAEAAEPDRTNQNGLDYYTVWFDEPVSGIHNLVLISGVEDNANVISLKLLDEIVVVTDPLTIGSLEELDGVYTLNVTQNKETTEGVALIVAKYDGEGRLIDFDMDEFAPEAGKIGTAETLSVTMTEGAGETVKAFVWNGLANLMPLK